MAVYNFYCHEANFFYIEKVNSINERKQISNFALLQICSNHALIWFDGIIQNVPGKCSAQFS